MQYEHATVAALRDLQPGLELALAAHRQVSGEVLELEVALGRERVGGQELGQPADLARAEGDVDEREALEDLVLDRLRPAAADPDDPGRVLGLEPLRLAEVGDEAVVGRLADRAGVEQDQVGLGALRGRPVAERLEHPPHPLGVVGVHLAPEGRHVIPLPSTSRHLRRSDGVPDPELRARRPCRRAHLRPPRAAQRGLARDERRAPPRVAAVSRRTRRLRARDHRRRATRSAPAGTFRTPPTGRARTGTSSAPTSTTRTASAATRAAPTSSSR